MPDAEPLYDVREETGNPEHASVDDVVERAQNPRADHEDAQSDTAMAAIIDTYEIESVRTVVQRILIDDEPFRTATNGLEMRNVDAVRIVTAASWFINKVDIDDGDAMTVDTTDGDTR